MSELRAYQIDQARSSPRLSIVVAWQGCASELSRRLRSLTQQLGHGGEIVVVCSCPAAERQRVERAHPGVQVIPASANEELSALRQRGVSAASGDIVVIFDDTVAPGGSWRDSVPPTLMGHSMTRGYDWVGLPHETHVGDASAR